MATFTTNIFDNGIKAVREAIAESYDRGWGAAKLADEIQYTKGFADGRRSAETAAALRITDARADERRKVLAEERERIEDTGKALQRGRDEVIDHVHHLFLDSPDNSADEFLYNRLVDILEEKFR